MAKSCSYIYPPLSLLDIGEDIFDVNEIINQDKARVFEDILAKYGVFVRVLSVSIGVGVTRYEFLPFGGTRIVDVTDLYDDIKLYYGGARIRIIKQVPGKAAMAMEITNNEHKEVRLRPLLEKDARNNTGNAVAKKPIMLGVGINKQIVTTDFVTMKNLLVTGSTGTGKSTFMQNIIIDCIYKYSPEEVKMILIDPKVVDYYQFRDLPHLVTPVINDSKKAVAALMWLCEEIENRLEQRENGAQSCDFCKLLVMVDELADLMILYPRETERLIVRILQMGNPVGIHIVVATQHQKAISGLIHVNANSIASFDSEQYEYDMQSECGEDFFLGQGEMLYSRSGFQCTERVQCPFVSSDETDRIMSFMAEKNGKAEYDKDVIRKIEEYESKIRERNR